MSLVPQTRFEWERAVLQVRMPPATKLVALALATFANRNGENAHPGNRRLARELCVSERTIERHIGWLLDSGLLLQTFRGSSAGRRRLASAYRLVIAEDLPTRVEFVATPDTSVGCSDQEHPTPGTDEAEEHPTRMTGTPDTRDRSPDTGVADHPTGVSAQQVVQQAGQQQGRSSSGALRAAVARTSSTTDQRVATGLALAARYEALGE